MAVFIVPMMRKIFSQMLYPDHEERQSDNH
jgi:hypothetical protein